MPALSTHTDSSPSPDRHALLRWPSPVFSGRVLILVWALALLDTLSLLDTQALATALAWLYVVVEFPRLSRRQLMPVVVLCLLGSAATLWAWSATGQVDLLALGSEHLKLAMLLTAVHFIRLATRLHSGGQTKGVKSFIATFGGMHVFSSVANFSSLLLVGDQIRNAQKQLSAPSYNLLSRGFALAIFWSPFLSMLPLALELVPGLEIVPLYPWALVTVAFGLLFTVLEARWRHRDEVAVYEGYPMRLDTLALPATLIGTLLLCHWLLPDVPMVAIISIVAVAVPLLWVLIRDRGHAFGATLKRHVDQQLPTARPEISLFLAAGFLAASVKACIAAGLISTPFDHTNALIASAAMLIIYAFSLIGVHQFALMSMLAGLMAQVTTTPVLMAMGYIAGVSLAMSGSPFSGLNAILQGHFQTSSRTVFRQNVPYTVVMMLFVTLLLLVMESLGVA